MMDDYCKVFADIKKLNPFFFRYINFGIYIFFHLGFLNADDTEIHDYQKLDHWVKKFESFIGLAIIV